MHGESAAVTNAICLLLGAVAPFAGVLWLILRHRGAGPGMVVSGLDELPASDRKEWCRKRGARI